ncbi:AAA family ATPase [Lacticaseibacillus paracasei]|uniref:AAA family ATPase n=1 Tax=Lacticaseibacillus paracasei TaxID=1597 RepID=UPI00066681B8|nr:AAA family ATPase [Lacticaseibacillus paracasei]
MQSRDCNSEWNTNRRRKNNDYSYVLALFKCNKEAFFESIKNMKMVSDSSSVIHYAKIIDSFLKSRNTTQNKINNETLTANHISLNIPNSVNDEDMLCISYRNYKGDLATSKNDKGIGQEIKNMFKDKKISFNEEILQDYLKCVLDYHTYIYVPAESMPSSLLKLTNIDFQRLMSSPVREAITSVLTNSKFNSESILDGLNSNLNKYLDTINTQVSSERRDYIFTTPSRSKKNITAHDLTEQIISAYFAKRSLFMIESDNTRLPIALLSSGEQKQAIINVFYSILINRSKDDNNDFLIWAIDEPETSQDYTHVLPQFERLEYLSSNKKIQILITTHWYGILPMASGGTAIQISPSEQKLSTKIDRFYLGHLKDEFGIKSMYDLATSVISYWKTYPDKHILLCEGSTDKIYLQSYLNSDRVKIIPVSGKGNVIKLVELLQASLRDVKSDAIGMIIAIIDTDPIKEYYHEPNLSSNQIKLMRWQISSKNTSDTVSLIPFNQRNTRYTQTAIEDVLNPEVFIKAVTETAAKFNTSFKNISLNSDALVSHLFDPESKELSAISYSGADLQDMIKEVREFINKHKGAIAWKYNEIYKTMTISRGTDLVKVALKKAINDDDTIFNVANTSNLKNGRALVDNACEEVIIKDIYSQNAFTILEYKDKYVIPNGTTIREIQNKRFPRHLLLLRNQYQKENKIINCKLKESITWRNKDIRDIAMFLVGRLIRKQTIDKYIQQRKLQ